MIGLALALVLAAEKVEPFDWGGQEFQSGWEKCFGLRKTKTAEELILACSRIIVTPGMPLDLRGATYNSRGLARARGGNLAGAVEDFSVGLKLGDLSHDIRNALQKNLDNAQRRLRPAPSTVPTTSAN